MRRRSPVTSGVSVELVNASFQAYSPVGVRPYLKNGPTVCDREIHLRHEARDEGMAEHRQMDMRGTPGVVVIAPGIGARLDGDETVVAGGIAHGAARAGEVRIERRRVLVADMDVAAAGIGLPDLDQRVRHAAAVLVAHMAMHDDALADRLAFVLGGEIGIAFAHGLVAVDRAGQFRQRVAHRDQGLVRRALDRALVFGRQRQRMRLVAIDGIDECHWRTPPRPFCSGRSTLPRSL
jgi:hypothetical protein